MQLSKRGEYGLRAMIRLAFASSVGQPPVIQIGEIADQEKIPLNFLEQILLSLKNSGLVQSRRGKAGGYYLAKPPNEIMLGQIVRILDGPLAPIRCVSQMAYDPCSCPDERTCGLRMTMEDVRNAIAGILDSTSLADVSARVNAAKSK